MALAPVMVASSLFTVASGAMQADATYRAGRAEARAAMTEAAMVEAATRQADMERREQIRRTRAAQRRFSGEQRAATAASGVVGTVGSPLDILGRTAALQELEIQDMAREASTAYSSGFAKAAQIRVAGKAALSGAKRASYGQLLSTGGQALGAYSAYKEKFPTKSLLPST